MRLGGCGYAVVQALSSSVGWDEAPAYEKPSPNYADLQKHQLVYLHLERTASTEAESRLEASSHLQWQLRNRHTCQRCEAKVKFSVQSGTKG